MSWEMTYDVSLCTAITPLEALNRLERVGYNAAAGSLGTPPSEKTCLLRITVWEEVEPPDQHAYAYHLERVLESSATAV